MLDQKFEQKLLSATCVVVRVAMKGPEGERLGYLVPFRGRMVLSSVVYNACAFKLKAYRPQVWIISFLFFSFFFLSFFFLPFSFFPSTL